MTTSPTPATGRSLLALVWRCVVVVAVAGLVALGVNAARPSGLPLLAGQLPSFVPLRSAVPCAGLPRAWWGRMQPVEPAAAYAFGREEAVLFIDARPHADYIFNHISGALEAPYNDFTAALAQEGSALTPGLRAVVYDGGEPCGEAVRVAKYLVKDYGATVYLLQGGYPAWEQAGLPITGGHARGELNGEEAP